MDESQTTPPRYGIYAMFNLFVYYMPTKICVLIVLCCVGCSSCIATPKPITVAKIASTQKPPSTTVIEMLRPRAAHSATRLADGRVLFAGGFQGAEEVVIENEVFDPRLDKFLPIGQMQNPRIGHTATLLKDGLVLIVGGWRNGKRIESAEMFDPLTNQFRSIAPLSTPRADHTATLLADGRVLIAGGFSARNTPQPRAEIFDPTTQRFKLVSRYGLERSGHTATLMSDGKVLLVGGTAKNDQVLTSVELFDPITEVFETTGDLSVRRRKHATVRLKNNQVMVVGGTDERDWNHPYNSTEIYDSVTGRFMAGPQLQKTRFKLQDAALMLPSGNALIAGGAAAIEVLDITTNRFNQVGVFDNDYFFSTATLLNDGRVLIAGGYDRQIQATQKAWLYK